jgi:hypothetical protein
MREAIARRIVLTSQGCPGISIRVAVTRYLLSLPVIAHRSESFPSFIMELTVLRDRVTHKHQNQVPKGLTATACCSHLSSVSLIEMTSLFAGILNKLPSTVINIGAKMWVMDPAV